MFNKNFLKIILISFGTDLVCIYYAAVHETVNNSSSLPISAFITSCRQLYIVKNIKTKFSQQSIY